MFVSVLIPAFRDTYLSQALSSVFCQTHTEMEIVISDDSVDDRVQKIVQNFKDSRIRYTRTAGRIGAVANVRNLWTIAQSRRIKFLFDDDFLMPFAITSLVEAMESISSCSFSFSHRHIVDHDGRIVANPTFVQQGQKVAISAPAIAAYLPGKVNNPIGELSNILINADAGVKVDDFCLYRGFEIEVLGDVALYLNATRLAPCVGVGLPLAAFRRHANQNSSPKFNPKFSAGLFEWELLIRGEFDAGALSPEQAVAAVETLNKVYANWIRMFPELSLFVDGLASLSDQIMAQDRNLLEGFRKNWITAWEAIRTREKK